MKHDWFSLYDIIRSSDKASAEQARKELCNSLTSVAGIFENKPFFMSDEITLVDCYLAPLLWRLPDLEITLPESADAIYEYADRIFAREEFQNSLTDIEKELR